MFRLELINIFIFDNPFGISINISLNSLINGGSTRIESVKITNVITTKTINKDSGLGNFNPVCTLLHKLQITFDITSEQIIKSMKSLKVHIIKKLIIITANLKKKELFNFRKYAYFFSEYPNPFDLA